MLVETGTSHHVKSRFAATPAGRIFNAGGKLLGLQENECFGYFIFTKILPRIYFFKENEKNEQFQEWLQKLEEYEEYDLGNILDNLQKQSEPENQQIQLVIYWG